MPKVAKVERKAVVARAGGEVMAGKGYDPILGIMSVIEEKKPWPEDESVAKSLLSRDWEPADEAGYLQPSVSLRLKAHSTLAEYGYSRVKATEVGDVNVGVQVVIEQPRALGGDSRRFEGRKGLGEGSVEVEVQSG